MLVIAGPTGSGKSDLALDLAQEFNGEIVNCDSVQIYRYLNIGTAKTPPSERRGIPHHLIDLINPDEIFTAGDYQRAGRIVLREITDRGSVPIVVGGTGFYFRALMRGLFEGPARDEALRARLLRRRPGSLHRLLTRFDPVAAKRIHANDTQKLARALEVCLLARAPISSLQAQQKRPQERYEILRIVLDPPREQLTQRIHKRCETMFANGLVEEVSGILARGFPRTAKALESIGYRESLQHIEGLITLEQALELTKIATRQYAKRQRTWFRREPGFTSLHRFGNDPQTVDEVKRLVTAFLQSHS